MPDQGDPTENALAEGMDFLFWDLFWLLTSIVHHLAGIIIRDFAFPEGDPRHGGHYPKEEYENEDEPIKVLQRTFLTMESFN